MSTLVQLPSMLVDHVELILTDYDTCTVDIFQYTAGEPAAPSGQCTVISSWVDSIYDMGGSIPLGRRGDEQPCVIRPAALLKLRVDVCYEESEQGPTPTEHALVADCFHGMLQAIWCGLAEEWVSGTLLDVGDCRGVVIGDFQVLPRQGGIVSATLDVATELACLAGDVPPPAEDESGFDDGFDEGFR